MRTMPVKKVGSETPAVTLTRHRWSTQVPGRVAANTPIGIAITQARMSAVNVSSSEAGRRLARSVATGRPEVSDMPRSPRKSSPT